MFQLIGGITSILAAVAGGAVVLAGCWLYDVTIDDPRVRRAVRAEMVTKAELAAEKAKAEGWKKIAARQAEIATEKIKRANQAEANAKSFEAEREQAENEIGDLQERLNDLRTSIPQDNVCVVDDDLVRRLRGR